MPSARSSSARDHVHGDVPVEDAVVGAPEPAVAALAEQVDQQVAAGEDVARSDRVRHWVRASSRHGSAFGWSVGGVLRPPGHRRTLQPRRADRADGRRRATMSMHVGDLASGGAAGRATRNTTTSTTVTARARSAATAMCGSLPRASSRSDAAYATAVEAAAASSEPDEEAQQEPAGAQTAEQPAQHEVGRRPSPRRTTRCRRAPAPARCPRRWSRGPAATATHDVDDGDDALDPEHRAGALERVEAAQASGSGR